MTLTVMRISVSHAVPTLLVTGLLLGTGLVGCAPSGAPAPDAPPAASACEEVATMLTTDDARPRAGDEMDVSIAPVDCPVDEQWAGELIVRTADGDTTTGTRFEIGETTVSVDLPPSLSGAAMLMLVPDRDCEGVGMTADCHHPFVEVEILP